MTPDAFRKLALSLPDAAESPHFEAASFRVKGKIFATLGEAEGRAVLKLTREQMEIMTEAEPDLFERIPNAWGEKGWTRLKLQRLDRQTALSALKTAWTNVTVKAAPKRRSKVRR